MTTYPSIEETLQERRSRLLREEAELKLDELRKENKDLRKALGKADPQNRKASS